MESTLRGLTRNRNVKHPPRSYTSEVGRAGLEPATNGLPIDDSRREVKIHVFPCAPDSFTSGLVRHDEADSGHFSGIGGARAAPVRPERQQRLTDRPCHRARSMAARWHALRWRRHRPVANYVGRLDAGHVLRPTSRLRHAGAEPVCPHSSHRGQRSIWAAVIPRPAATTTLGQIRPSTMAKSCVSPEPVVTLSTSPSVFHNAKARPLLCAA
jgi:hypothetical protein